MFACLLRAHTLSPTYKQATGGRPVFGRWATVTCSCSARRICGTCWRNIRLPVSGSRPSPSNVWRSTRRRRWRKVCVVFHKHYYTGRVHVLGFLNLFVSLLNWEWGEISLYLIHGIILLRVNNNRNLCYLIKIYSDGSQYYNWTCIAYFYKDSHFLILVLIRKRIIWEYF